MKDVYPYRYEVILLFVVVYKIDLLTAIHMCIDDNHDHYHVHV